MDRRSRDRVRALEKLVNERHRFYQAQFKTSDKAVKTALQAQKEQTAAAFASSEKSGEKAESAQKDYNVRSNEFRGQLDDQAKTLMPRSETVQMFKSIEEKIVSLDEHTSADLEAARAAWKSDLESVRSAWERDRSNQNQQRNWMIGIIITIFVALVGLLKWLKP